MAAAIGITTLGILFIASGLKGLSIADLLAGAVGGALNPKGGSRSFGEDALSTVAASADAATVETGQAGTRMFGNKPVAAWIYPILVYARAHGWQGTVTSGVRTKAEQTAIYNSGVRPAAVPGTSNHEQTQYPGGAVDVTDAANLSRILLASPYKTTLVWAGAKDPVHFSHPHNGSY